MSVTIRDTFLEDMRQYLITASGEIITLASMPQDGDRITTLLRYGGMAPTATLLEPIATRRPRMQVLVRGVEYGDVRDRTDRLFDLLAHISNTQIGQSFYLSVSILGEPLPLPIDTNGRIRFAFSCEAELRSA